ncbi:MAG: ATP-dependent Clp protease adaptor ClpS [Ferruginibacter sp.]
MPKVQAINKHFSYNPFTSPEQEESVLTLDAPVYSLIVWNDEVNTFDWVIETLMQVCGHSPEQAEQCTILIHFKGKCAVKKGNYEDLEPLKDAILERQIGATIEKIEN